MSSPLFFQGQGGVNAAGLCVRVAAGGGGWQQGRRRGSQDLLGPALLPQVLMLLLRLGWRMLGLPGERGVGCLIFGRALGAVKLCCRKKSDEEVYKVCLYKGNPDSVPEFEPSAEASGKHKIRRQQFDDSCKMSFSMLLVYAAYEI